MYKFWKRDPRLEDHQAEIALLRDKVRELDRGSYLVAATDDPENEFFYRVVPLPEILERVLEHLGLELEYIPGVPAVSPEARLVVTPKATKKAAK